MSKLTPTPGQTVGPFYGYALPFNKDNELLAPGSPGSHRGKGWEAVTAAAITALVERGGPLVAILWGRDARNLVPHLGAIPCVESAHPSPLSAHSGFFGSRPFSRANELLVQQGADPIDWRLP